MSSENILANLRNFGIVDLMIYLVVKVFKEREERKEVRVDLKEPMKAVEVPLRRQKLIHMVEHDSTEWTEDFLTLYGVDGVLIGYSSGYDGSGLLLGPMPVMEPFSPPKNLMVGSFTVPVMSRVLSRVELLNQGEPSSLAIACDTNHSFKLRAGEQRPFNTVVVEGENVLGYIDSDRQFNYESASSLRLALGWAIATDGGHDREIKGFDLDAATTKLAQVVAWRGASEQVFFGEWFDTLKNIFEYDQTTRFADGYCGVANFLWEVACREYLGIKHKGYSFAY